MLKEYIPKRLAKELKDLGFDQDCLAWWFENSEISVPTQTRGFCKDWNRYESNLRISAPFWQQAFRYFREKHSLIAVPHYVFVDDEFKYYDVLIYDSNSNSGKRVPMFAELPTYEEAEVECIECLIKIVKERNIYLISINNTNI